MLSTNNLGSVCQCMYKINENGVFCLLFSWASWTNAMTNHLYLLSDYYPVTMQTVRSVSCQTYSTKISVHWIHSTYIYLSWPLCELSFCGCTWQEVCQSLPWLCQPDWYCSFPIGLAIECRSLPIPPLETSGVGPPPRTYHHEWPYRSWNSRCLCSWDHWDTQILYHDK